MDMMGYYKGRVFLLDCCNFCWKVVLFKTQQLDAKQVIGSPTFTITYQEAI